jgi:transposase
MPRGGSFKRYSEEFKQTAVELALSGTKSIIQIAKDLEMSDKTLHNWISKHRLSDNSFEQKTNKSETQEEENKRLRKENAMLKMERDILKKATAYFAKDAM